MNQSNNNQSNNKSDQPGYRRVGIDQFDGTGEAHYITEADCLEPAEGWGNEEWSDEDIRREAGED